MTDETLPDPEHDPELLRVIAHGLASEMPPEVDHPAMRLRNERDREYAAMDVLDALRVAGYRIERARGENDG